MESLLQNQRDPPALRQPIHHHKAAIVAGIGVLRAGIAQAHNELQGNLIGSLGLDLGHNVSRLLELK
ncbi:hypothetical protein ACVWXE_001807 [Thermostichus sp. MS-CIW-41]